MGKWERSGGNGIDWHRFSAIHLVGWWGRAESFPRRNRNRQVDSSKSLQKKMTDGQAGLKKRRGQEIARSRVERHDGRRRMNPSGEELSTHCVGIHPTLHHLFSFLPLFFFFFFVSFSFFPFDLLPTCSSRVSCLVCVRCVSVCLVIVASGKMDSSAPGERSSRNGIVKAGAGRPV